MHARLKIAFFLSIVLALISPPFIFDHLVYVGKEIRAFLGITVLLLLFLESGKLRIIDIFLIFLLLALLFLEFFLSMSDVSNIASYYSVVLVAFSLYRVLRGNKLRCDIFVSLWFRFSYALSIAAILAFFIHQFTSLNADFLNFSSIIELPALDYRVSIFGLTLDKNFGFMKLARICSYFVEPQYAGMFFSVNTLLAKKNSKSMPRSYFAVCVLAGLLTFSVTFYLVFVVILMSYIKPNEIKAIVIPTLLILSVILVFYVLAESSVDKDALFVRKTSFGDRLDRMENSVGILYNAPVTNFLFGHGVGYKNDFDRGISSGFFHVWVERGLAGLCFVFIMLTLYSNKNRTLILASMIFILAIPWYKHYIFWYGIILCGLIYINTFRHKSADNKNGLLS